MTPAAFKHVSFLSDFGGLDSYVAEVKAVLLGARVAPIIVDITHEVPAFDVELGAFHLLRAYRYFPKGTCHLAVVDPGVGSHRRALYVKVGNHHFVGPDNGLLLWAVRDCESREKARSLAYEIPVPKLDSPTFHGRDVFAPFIANFSSSRLKKVAKLEGREFPANEIVAVDRYGNLITSVPVTQRPIMKLAEAPNYSAIEKGKVALIRGSHGFWEISAREASAAKLLGLKRGDKLVLK